MGITVGGKERKYIEAMEYGDFENSKELNKGSELVKELYIYNYFIIFLRLNKKWDKDPNINKKLYLMYLNHDYKNKNKYNYDFFRFNFLINNEKYICNDVCIKYRT